MESDKSGLPAPIGLIPATAGGGTVGGIIGWQATNFQRGRGDSLSLMLTLSWRR